MLAKPSPTTASAADSNILTDASHMPTIERFRYLVQRTRNLVHSHGPYTTYADTTVLTRAPHPHARPHGPSSTCLAKSLAAAQDCIGSAQIHGPAKDDLHIFKHLRDTTVDLLEEVLATGELDHESFGWGVFGLCAGYVYPPSEASYELFEEHKHRLHEALLALPTMDSPKRMREELVVKGERKIEVLAVANRQVHICASLVLQRFRQEGWHRIRWWHGAKVAERWVGRLGLVDERESVDEQLREPKMNRGGNNDD